MPPRVLPLLALFLAAASNSMATRPWVNQPAVIEIAGVPPELGPMPAVGRVQFDYGAVAGMATIQVSGKSFGFTTAPGYETFLQDITEIDIRVDGAGDSATFDAETGILEIIANEASGTADIDDLAGALFTSPLPQIESVDVMGNGAQTVATAQAMASTFEVSRPGRNAGASQINITSVVPGESGNGIAVDFSLNDSVSGAHPAATYDSGPRNVSLMLSDSEPTSLQQAAQAIDSLQDFTAGLEPQDDELLFYPALDAPPTLFDFEGGKATGGGIPQQVQLRLQSPDTPGKDFLFSVGSTLEDLVNKFNEHSDLTGVIASGELGVLRLQSIQRGSHASIALSVLSESGEPSEEKFFTEAIGAGTSAFGSDAIPEPYSLSFVMVALAIGASRRSSPTPRGRVK